jgi:thioesterase domain-containing protein
MRTDQDHFDIEFSSWTTSQRELWPLQNLEANTASLNTGQFTELFGDFDEAAFTTASKQALEECEALRARIVDGADGPRLHIAPLGDWTPDVLDLSAEADPRARALDWMQEALATSFDPGKALFSWTLIRLGKDRCIWCFIVHQLALDGSGRNLVARRLSALYNELVGTPAGETAPLSPLADLLREDAAYRASPDFEASRAYWSRQTADLPPAPRLSRTTAGGSYVAARRTAPLAASTTEAVRAFMAKTGISSSGLFACMSAIYLHCMTGASDVVVGLLVAARANDAMRRAPGNVSNTVPLRIKFTPGMTLDALITQVRARIREALKHQRFPLSEMKATMPSLTGELFSIAVNVMKFDYALGFGATTSVSHNLSNGPVDDLSVSVFEQPGEDGLQIALNGNVGRYSTGELVGHYDRLISVLIDLCACDPATAFENNPAFKNAERLFADLNAPAAGASSKSTTARPAMAPAAYVAPANDREALVCRLFAEMLGGGDPVSVNDNFFESGGHSLLAARLVSRLSSETKTKIPLRTIFENPTPRSLAGALAANQPVERVPSQKPMLVLCPGGGVLSREVISLQKFLSNDFSILMIDYPDWRSQWDVFFNIEKYLATVVAQIQREAPTPRALRLVGYSFGAGIAYAMAIVLARLGYTIELVGLIDGRSPAMREAAPLTPKKSRPARIVEFLRRDGVTRSRQLGRYVGIRAKKPVVSKLLQWVGPLLPTDQSSEFAFYLTAFINAAIPMQAIRDWSRSLGDSERLVSAKSILVRSMDNDDGWPEDLGWRELIPAIDIKLVPGTHFTVIGDSNLATVRAHLLGETPELPPASKARVEPPTSNRAEGQMRLVAQN